MIKRVRNHKSEKRTIGTWILTVGLGVYRWTGFRSVSTSGSILHREKKTMYVVFIILNSRKTLVRNIDRTNHNVTVGYL